MAKPSALTNNPLYNSPSTLPKKDKAPAFLALEAKISLLEATVQAKASEVMQLTQAAAELESELKQVRQRNEGLLLENTLLKQENSRLKQKEAEEKDLTAVAKPDLEQACEEPQVSRSRADSVLGSTFSAASRARSISAPQPPPGRPKPKLHPKQRVPEKDFIDMMAYWNQPRLLLITLLCHVTRLSDALPKIHLQLKSEVFSKQKEKIGPLLTCFDIYAITQLPVMSREVFSGIKAEFNTIIKGLIQEEKLFSPDKVYDRFTTLASSSSEQGPGLFSSRPVKLFYSKLVEILNQVPLDWKESDPLPGTNLDLTCLNAQQLENYSNKITKIYHIFKYGALHGVSFFPGGSGSFEETLKYFHKECNKIEGFKKSPPALTPG